MAEASQQFTLTDGTRLNVDQSVKEGLPVIFQHGLCGDAGQTREAFPPQRGFCRFTLEMRGHGHSEAGDAAHFSIDTFTRDLAAFIGGRFEQPVIVGGISMGAAIAARLAITRPDLVSGLVLARPAWVTQSAPENMAPNAEVGRLLANLPPDAAKTRFLAGDTAQNLVREAPDNLSSLLGFFSRQPLAVTSALLTSISSDGPDISEEQLRHLTIPTLVIGHKQDSVHPIVHAVTIAGLIPGARFVEITPKAQDRVRYVADFHSAMHHFLKDFF
jgi:pimeloyl-ACP methyl ester carboxylesterase